MTDLQETPIPVTDTGSNPPENPFGWNPWEVQANPFAEQSWTLDQPQENVVAEQPTPVAAPDLTDTQTVTTNEVPTDSVEAATQNAVNLPDSQAMANAAAKKERLTQLLKAEQEKWKKAWFTRWILSWVAITACVLAISVIFAKDQIVDLLSDGSIPNSNLEASVVNLTSETPAIDEETPAIDKETPAIDEEITIIDNSISVHDWYTIRHVNSVEEANWVLPSNCTDLTCYGADAEFVNCTKFRMDENMDENSQRIWSSGACKYKDSSELVYVEFNN